jgi:2-oxoglutarate dehydrogenase E1 component
MDGTPGQNGHADPRPTTFGANDWLVDEMRERWEEDPDSVSEEWRTLFGGPGLPTPAAPGAPLTLVAPSALREPPAPVASAAAPAAPVAPPVAPTGAPTPTPTPASDPAPAAVAAAPAPAPVAPAPAPEGSELLRGAAARIVTNMEASLHVPTATSFRVVPAKLLEVNRTVVNGYLGRTHSGKVSFTHLIGFAVVKALRAMSAMRRTYVEVDGKPAVVHHDHVGLGLAVDVEKPDGTRTLFVPVVKDADTLDFAGFHTAYEALIRKVRANKLSPDDFAGATATLTNPGTIGTVQSVPRLMPGQGVIVGVGTIDFPAEYHAADRRALAELGVSKVVTLTSTYDHRIIQGAESGLFLKKIHELLLGADGFYEEIFQSLGVPYDAVQWRADVNPVDSEESDLHKQLQVHTLVNMYRVRGHLIADLDPLRLKVPPMHAELDPATNGLTIWDLDREFLTDGLAGEYRLPLSEILGILRDAYCRTVGVEYMHIQEPDQKRWIQEHVEGVSTALTAGDQHHILEKLNAAEAFERFLATKYVGAKRFGIEGAESAVPLLDAMLESAAEAGLDGAVLGMAHRGRLNVLANVVGKSIGQIFNEFEGNVDADMVQGSGDVKYHLGAKGTFASRSGRVMPVQLAANPSHLETVDPVVEGMVRAMQDVIDRPAGTYTILPLLIHGDAAFAGQGVVSEVLNLSDLKGYRTGGTIHLIVNNQLGFTTAPEYGRSTVYATDVAKAVQAPIFHVNGDDPEACVRIARLAFAFRQEFHKDVVVDMWCYRRHGHNEGDDPSYTQPLMYRRIDEHASVRNRYVDSLVKRGDISLGEAEQALADFNAMLQAAFDQTRAAAPPKGIRARPALPSQGPLPHIPTGFDLEGLGHIVDVLDRVPDDFTVHPKLARQFETRRQLWDSGEVDWALGEALAFGSVLLDGHDIRFSGQDSRRGVDYENGSEYAPLTRLDKDQGKFWIYDSSLSEYAAMGFEYGYSTVHVDALVCWEAQFGDFVNGAQIVIDQYLAASEDKWNQRSGLVLLLPHGYDGQGPEHSSGRIERFLTLCAEDNLQVANCTNAAQYFHLLRRQVRTQSPKPLIVFTPKYLLRSKDSRSPVSAFTEGSFEEVLDDPNVTDPASIRRVVLCSGKVAFDLMKRQVSTQAPVAVVRLEQLYPFPASRIIGLLDRYENADSVFWVQEEPENMGPWPFVHTRLHNLLPGRAKLGHSSRSESGSPATGSAAVHQQEQEELVERAFDGV